jgi:hypothetical protein
MDEVVLGDPESPVGLTRVRSSHGVMYSNTAQGSRL